jgi:transformation/transcription domain-associated protein
MFFLQVLEPCFKYKKMLDDDYEILLWKQPPDWGAYLKDNVIPKAQVEETRVYFSLHDTNGDAENIVVGGKVALEQLPEMSSIPCVGGLYAADLKDILETWRLTTPNDWDHLPVWFQWRNEMYNNNAVIDAFANTISHRHKEAWNVNNKLARGRRHHVFCVTVLYGHSTMEVQV